MLPAQGVTWASRIWPRNLNFHVALLPSKNSAHTAAWLAYAPMWLDSWQTRPRGRVACLHTHVDSCTHQIHAELTSFDVLLIGTVSGTKKVALKCPRQDREPTPPPEIKLLNLNITKGSSVSISLSLDNNATLI